VTEAGGELWEVWYPNAGATGLLVGRGQLDATDVLWLHSAPEVISVRVRDEGERLVAAGRGLRRDGEQLPMTRLSKADDEVRREDRWPTTADLGALVLLPGGEVGELVEWWNAEDGSEWRWRLEFRNHK
jgi:NTP pyrophosphatase (non-canonical NTP hydrolase)